MCDTEKLVYLLGPVRHVSENQRPQIEAYKAGLLNRGFLVFDPLRDAPQEDRTGYNIVMAELGFLRRRPGPEVHAFWLAGSEGSWVDLGVVVALGLKTVCVRDFSMSDSRGCWKRSIRRTEELWKVSRKVLEEEKKVGVIWRVEMGDQFINDRLNLGFVLSRLEAEGGQKITSLLLSGVDDPRKKSYPKVVREIMRRQSNNELLW